METLLTILFILLGIILLLLLIILSARIINFNKHKIKSTNGIDEGLYLSLCGMEQYVHIRSEDSSNPVIIYLHGGPGGSDSNIAYLFEDQLDEKYTIVSWDQRGAGRSYEHNKKIDPKNDTVSFNQALLDLDELVDYIRQRFKQDKVIIMGHSYGTLLGSQYVLAHHEKVLHYIGVGQVVDIIKGERVSYEDALNKAKKANDDTSKLEEAWMEYQKDTSDINKMLAVRKHTFKYHKASKKQIGLWSILSSPYTNMYDIRYLLRTMNRKEFGELQKNLLNSIYMNMMKYVDYQVSVNIIMGEYDWTCPCILAKEYYEMINTPTKGYHEIEGSGHAPLFDDPIMFGKVVKDILG